YSRPAAEPQLIFGGTLRHDWTAFLFKVLFLFSAAVTSLLSVGLSGYGDRGEYYALMLVSAIGMNLMASAADLVMLYLAIETTSIPLYILAGFLRSEDASTESGLKYFLFGAVTSTVMLYGFSLVYGLSGETNLYALAGSLAGGEYSLPLLIAVSALVLVGFSFKVAAVPFHFWTPDVYQGAPTPITAFISTASKAAGFAV
ncbi:MAG: NADH-quinone oxidoreductase subunit N, partial [Desulfuromonadales bacterium]|nr:NADH-quinone oxidoreductase subunit N [Desulfuromonadales bacterium]NIS40105.1 NADH-quinone oxidoreductase subunit N [Desulfuromonadales bacterium]